MYFDRLVECRAPKKTVAIAILASGLCGCASLVGAPELRNYGDGGGPFAQDCINVSKHQPNISGFVTHYYLSTWGSSFGEAFKYNFPVLSQEKVVIYAPNILTEMPAVRRQNLLDRSVSSLREYPFWLRKLNFFINLNTSHCNHWSLYPVSTSWTV